MHFNNRYSCYTPVSMGTEIQPKRRGHVQKKETSIVLVNSNTRKKKLIKKKNKFNIRSNKNCSIPAATKI